MKLKINVLTAVMTVFYAFIANAWLAIRSMPVLLCAIIPLFLLINIFAGNPYGDIKGKLLCTEYHGVECLIIFIVSCIVSAVYHLIYWLTMKNDDYFTLGLSILWCVVTLAVLFWNGMLCVYFTSVQLGIKIRVIGLVWGLIFPVNACILVYIIAKCREEVRFEMAKDLLNESRKEEKICATKYPVLMVHGVFFRDFRFLNYWGRIPAELRENGAKVFFGEHQSARAVSDSADEIALRIKAILDKTGAEKVNIIAHSKGGLDSRCAIAEKGMAPFVASLITINTPHRGCGFADYLLEKLKPSVQKKIEDTYNSVAGKAGDEDPDFMAAVKDLTAEKCKITDEKWGVPEGIYCRSVGSQLKKARNGKFPLNFSYRLVKYFDGENDGLVSESSFNWGENYTYLKPEKKRGISHGDMIDLNRENIPGFDVREFYVQMVADLKKRGF